MLLQASVAGWYELGRASELPSAPPAVREFGRRPNAPRGDRIDLESREGASSDSEAEADEDERTRQKPAQRGAVTRADGTAEGGEEGAAGGRRNSLFASFERALVERSHAFFAARAADELGSCGRGGGGGGGGGGAGRGAVASEGVLAYLDWVVEALRVEEECAQLLPDARAREAMGQARDVTYVTYVTDVTDVADVADVRRAAEQTLRNGAGVAGLAAVGSL